MKWSSQLAFLWLPFIVAAMYYFFVASDRYVSEATFVLKKHSAESQTSLDIGSLVGGGVVQNQDALLVQERILSLDMLKALEQALNLRQHYSDPERDWLYRLPKDASQEDFLEYYRSRLEVVFDDVSSVLTVRADAFTPEQAQRIAKAILKRGEAFVNEIGHRMAEERMQFVADQLALAQEKLRATKQAIIAFQNTHHLVSPLARTESLAGIVNGLETKLAEQETALKSQTSFLNVDAPQVVATRNKIEALVTQIEAEKTRMVGTGETKLNDLVADFEDLEIDLEFASDIYRSTLTALETARVEASRKLKHLVVLESPSLPEEALYPRRLYALITIFVFLALIYGIARLTVATIRDHKD